MQWFFLNRRKLWTEICYVLKFASVEQISAKKVRKHIEKKLHIDSLIDFKPDIKAMTDTWIKWKREGIEYSAEESDCYENDLSINAHVSQRNSFHGIEENISGEYPSNLRDTTAGTSKKNPSRKRNTRNDASVAQRGTRVLSPQLAALVGQETMTIVEVMKKINFIIKERNLYDPNNKKYVICDDSLYQVIGIRRFRIYGMIKYIKKHFLS